MCSSDLHCGPAQDDHLGYREEADIKKWAARDPLAIARARLEARDGQLDQQIAAAELRLTQDIDSIIEAVRCSPRPDPATLMRGVFAP